MTIMRKGFTLIEIVIVVIVVAILSISVFFFLGNKESITIDGAVNKVAADIKYTQNLSMSTGTWHGITFSADPANTYSIYATDGTTDTTIYDPLDLSKAFTIDVLDKFGAAIASANIAGGSKIEFSPYGEPYDDKNGTAITVEGVVVFTSGNNTKTIKIIQNTGKITIE